MYRSLENTTLLYKEIILVVYTKLAKRKNIIPVFYTIETQIPIITTDTNGSVDGPRSLQHEKYHFNNTTGEKYRLV